MRSLLWHWRLSSVGCTIDVPQILELPPVEKAKTAFEGIIIRCTVEPQGRIELDVIASCLIDSCHATIASIGLEW